MSGWSKEQDDKLRELWDAGLSASAISRHIPEKSRNAVIGRSSRIGLSGRPNLVKRHTTMAPVSDHQRRARRNEQQNLRNATRGEIEKSQRVAAATTTAPMHKRGFVYVSGPRSVVPLDAETRAENVGKMTLGQVQDVRGCLWGFGHVPAMTFCGKVRAVGADNYCPDHQRRAFRWVGE